MIPYFKVLALTAIASAVSLDHEGLVDGSATVGRTARTRTRTRRPAMMAQPAMTAAAPQTMARPSMGGSGPGV
jgi:hypothetical protein